MMIYIRYLLVGLIILLLHISVVPLIVIKGISPDLMLILIVYIALRSGQALGSVVGFIFGLLIDFTVDFILGLSALSKSVAGFIGGYFYNEAKIDINTGTSRFSGIVFLCSLVDNLVYFSLDIFGGEFGWLEILRVMIGRSIYTLIFSLILILITSKRLS